MVFSRSYVNLDNLSKLSMNGAPVEYVTSITYLGVTICSQKSFSLSAKNDLRNFYRSANSILNAINKADDVMIHLLYTNSVPTLTYACGVKSYSSRELQDCNTALNNALRKIFTYNRWESVRELRESFGYETVQDSGEGEIALMAKIQLHQSFLIY